MKKILVTILGLVLAVSCAVAPVKVESKNYHSKKGFTHTHLTIEKHDDDEIDVDLEIKGKDLEFEAKKIKDGVYQGERGEIIEYLSNNEVRITIDGEKVELYLLEGNGHSHSHEHHHSH